MTKIPYLHGNGMKGELWSSVTGCSDKGCKVKSHCWAKAMVKRFPAIHGQFFDPICGHYEPTPFGNVRFHPERLDKPLHWRKPRRVGVCFMGDLFDNQIPYSWQLQVFKKGIEASIQHKFFFLTKQPNNMKDAVLNAFRDRQRMIPMNFYWGVSICDQEDADTKIPDLLRIPGRHWVSVEPLLSPIDISRYIGYYPIKNGRASNETNDQRENHLSVSDIRGTRDRQSGEDLEGQEKNREENGWNPLEALRDDKGGETMGRISSGSSNDKLEEILHPSPSSCLSSFPRSDSGGDAPQPQEWGENRQQARELGIDDLFGEHQAHDRCSQKRTGSESIRRIQFNGETHGETGGGNQDSLCERQNESTGISQKVRGCISNDFKNSTRKHQDKGEWANSGLYPSQTEQRRIQKQQGSILFCVIGPESGKDRRPCPIENMVSVAEQCQAASVPLWVKQIDLNGKVCHDINLFPEALKVRQTP